MTGQWRSVCGVAVLGAVVLGAGCQQHRPRGPFSDVTQRERGGVTAEEVSRDPASGGRLAELPAVGPATPEPGMISPPADATARPGMPESTAVEPALPRPVWDESMVALPVTRTSLSPTAVRLDVYGGARRDWPVAVAYRPSGDVVAGPTYWKEYWARANRPGWQLGFIEPAEFLINSVLLPFRAVVQPPGAKVVYSEVDDASTSPAEVNE